MMPSAINKPLPVLRSDSSWTPVARLPGGKLLCRCVCGTERANLIAAFTRTTKPSLSCGCKQYQRVAAALTKHGHSANYGHSPEYASWHSMMQRTSNPNDDNFARYGGRGIFVCAAWRSFETFLSDMGQRPTRRHSIDRKNNDGSYTCGKCDECAPRGEAANCRWATAEEQQSNRSNSEWLTIDSVARPVSEWARVFGLDPNVFRQRLVISGWPIERAVGAAVGHETPWARRDRILRAIEARPTIRGTLLRALYQWADGPCRLTEEVPFSARARRTRKPNGRRPKVVDLRRASALEARAS